MSSGGLQPDVEPEIRAGVPSRRDPESSTGAPVTVGQLRRFLAADYRRTKRALLVNPAVTVPAWFRISQLLWRKGLRPLAKLIEWHLVRSVGSQLAPSAEAGPGLSLPHPVGIVLGAQTRLGRNVTLAQNVTLGSNFKRVDRERRQPTLGDNVWIAAGAVVAGPVLVGDGALVGANSVVLKDVPAGGVVRSPTPDVRDLGLSPG